MLLYVWRRKESKERLPMWQVRTRGRLLCILVLLLLLLVDLTLPSQLFFPLFPRYIALPMQVFVIMWSALHLSKRARSNHRVPVGRRSENTSGIEGKPSSGRQ